MTNAAYIFHITKRFRKTNKTIEDQGKNKQKQLKILEDNQLNLIHLLKHIMVLNIKLTINFEQLILKEKYVYDKIVTEGNNKINTLNDKIKYGNLTRHFKCDNRPPISFNGFNRSFGLIRR